jgi:hypothetical protein
MVRIAVMVLFLFALSCNQGTSTPRCERICQRDAACFKELGDDSEHSFDRGDCERACGALERDDWGREQVAKHAKCVGSATTCAAVRACR